MNPAVAPLVPRPGGCSFPSGHTTAAFAAVGALLFARAPRRMVASALAVACVIASSRLYLYAHFPTDVLAGAALGPALGWAAVRLVDVCARRLPRVEGRPAMS